MNCLKSQKLEDVMTIRTLSWAGSVIRMGDSELPARIINCNPEVKRRLGRPKARWFDVVDNDVVKRVRQWRI
jgi:hypothetical protein